MTQSYDELNAKMKARIVIDKKVIGMTITGASINQQLLQEIAPAIVIVEEAAEVLESDLLAALSPGLKHLVLIGDHKQLPPNVETYKLKKDYSFDVSMMERLICNKFPFKQLCLQSRMRPEFSAFLKDIYPDLQDNLRLLARHPLPAEGLVNSMCFWNHDEPEEVGRSKSNVEECRRAVLLAEYLMSTGIKANKITILAAYQGQVSAIRKLMTERRNSLPHSSLTSEERVELSTIDRFQGDENDFIIVSLVRCNSEGAIGFLMAPSRRCVAQARARCGMYLIGSAASMTHRPGSPWISLLKSMRDSGHVSDFLAVQCVKHKGKSVANIRNADDFEQLVREKGKNLCKLACAYSYSCGVHKCTKPCVPSHDHGPCMTEVIFKHNDCGHVEKVACSEKQRNEKGDEKIKCKVQVKFDMSGCKHVVMKPCHQRPEEIICRKIVDYKGVCGHPLSRECYMQPSQVQCNFSYAKKRSCGHPCVNRCGEPCDCSKCCKENRRQAKDALKKLKEKMKSGLAFSRTDLKKEDYDFTDVWDMVNNSVKSMHNWKPCITRIEKIRNKKLEIQYEKYRSTAFGIGEKLKFHGTADTNIESIIKDGFVLGKDGMYGGGIYFASNSSKSYGYTKGSNKLLLCQVYLGKAKTVCTADNTLSKERLRKERCDSVFARRGTQDTGGVYNDEFVVYDKRQAYVKYIIHYK
jgi:hypothetical protein